MLADLIRDELDQMIDIPLWADRKEDEEQNRAVLKSMAENPTSAEIPPPPPY